MVLHFDHRVRDQVVDLVAQQLGRQSVLLEGLGVHEVVLFALGVEVLHLSRFQRNLFEAVAGGEFVFADRPGAVIPHLGLDKTSALAGGAVLHLIDRADLALKHHDHTGAQLCSLNVQVSPFLSFWMIYGTFQRPLAS